LFILESLQNQQWVLPLDEMFHGLGFLSSQNYNFKPFRKRQGDPIG
jgi:hypothetical protein